MRLSRAQGTIKQRAFIRHLFDVSNPQTFGNGTQSARKARYKGSDNTLAVVAHENLRKPNVIIMAESLAQNILSTEEVEKEITSIATTITPVDGSMKMKALDLLTKIKAMQSSKLETVDLTQQSATESALLKSIQNAAKRDDIQPESAAIQLFQALSDDPALCDLSTWPDQFRPAIQSYLQQSEQVTEISDQ